MHAQTAPGPHRAEEAAVAARKGVADASLVVADASPVVAGAAAKPYPALQQPTLRLDGTNDPPCAPHAQFPNTAR